MHKEVKQFIRKVRYNHPSYFFFSDVLEFGSLNINGSPRWFFWGCDYTGIDIANGRGVDVVCSAHEYDNGMYSDVVVSTEMLEHCSCWKEALINMYNHTKPGGLMIITCAAPQREPHGTTENHPYDSPLTNDYYRNISRCDFKQVLKPGMFNVYFLKYARGCKDLLFYGIKK